MGIGLLLEFRGHSTERVQREMSPLLHSDRQLDLAMLAHSKKPVESTLFPGPRKASPCAIALDLDRLTHTLEIKAYISHCLRRHCNQAS